MTIVSDTEKPREWCPEHDDAASRRYERFLERLLVPACPALPSAEPYGLLPEPSHDEATRQAPCSFSDRLAMLVCLAVTLLILAVIVAAYVFFVFPDSDKAEELYAAETVPDVFLLGEVDDIVYIPGTVEELIEFSFGWEDGFSLSPGLFDEIPEEDGTHAFSLNEQAVTPSLPDGIKEELDSTISDIEEHGAAVSCLFVDVENGLGYAYNIDDDIYGASSFKAPLASFILSHVSDIEGISPSVAEQLRLSVEQSDNAAFVSLSNAYRHTSEFDSWMRDELSIDDESMFSLGDFATYSARDAAKMWTFITRYIDSGTQGAAELAEFCSNTNMSFIRDGIAAAYDKVIEYEANGGGDIALVLAPPESLTVYNKAGWFSDYGTYSSTTDNALIDVDGHRYIMCILTSLPYSESSASLVSDLVSCLFSTRCCLVAQDEISPAAEAEASGISSLAS